LLLGDHPPEVSASEFLCDLQCGVGDLPCVVLLGSAGPFSEQYFYSLGASGVIAEREWDEICLRVQEWFRVNRAAAAV
jgi:hypothetical protein